MQPFLKLLHSLQPNVAVVFAVIFGAFEQNNAP